VVLAERIAGSEKAFAKRMTATAGSVSHPDRQRMDRCIDYIWVAGAIRIVDSGVCFNRPSSQDPSLWPPDHVGVWADLALRG
jgi:hypothetical protein